MLRILRALRLRRWIYQSRLAYSRRRKGPDEGRYESTEHKQFEMLLPWYVTGKLDNAGKDVVESYLARHQEFSSQLDIVREEREQSVLANESITYPPFGAHGRTMQRLPPTEAPGNQRLGIQVIINFFTDPSPRVMRLAAMAAAALVLMQTATIVSLVTRNQEATYQTSSGASIVNETRTSVVVLIMFTSDATAGDIAQLLTEVGARIVDGPKPGYMFKVVIKSMDSSAEAQDALLQRLASRRDIVQTVLLAKD